MKKIRMMISGFALLALVTGALAFKSKSVFASGSVWCSSTCPAGEQIAFKVDPNGTTTVPCGVGNQPYAYCGNTCTATPAGTKFKATSDQ